MEIEFSEAPKELKFDRVFGIDVIVRNFKGCPHLEITLFRAGASEAELQAIKDLDLVGEPDPSIPKEVLQGATKERALQCILENFTQEEAKQFVDYLEKRYAHLVEKVIVAPLDFPIPLGAGPLAELPVTENSGFICFDKAPGYPLPFAVRAYYDFTLQEELSSVHE